MFMYRVSCTDCEKEYLITVAALDCTDAEIIAEYVMKLEKIHSVEMSYEAFEMYPTQNSSGYYDMAHFGYGHDVKYFDTVASVFYLLNPRKLRIDEILLDM